MKRAFDDIILGGMGRLFRGLFWVGFVNGTVA